MSDELIRNKRRGGGGGGGGTHTQKIKVQIFSLLKKLNELVSISFCLLPPSLLLQFIYHLEHKKCVQKGREEGRAARSQSFRQPADFERKSKSILLATYVLPPFLPWCVSNFLLLLTYVRIIAMCVYITLGTRSTSNICCYFSSFFFC